MNEVVEKLSNEIVTYSNNGDYGAITELLNSKELGTILMCLSNVVMHVSDKAFDTIGVIASRAILLESQDLNNEAEIQKRFNDAVDEALGKTDFNNSVTIDSFGIVCDVLRKNLHEQFELKRGRDSIFKRASSFLGSIFFK